MAHHTNDCIIIIINCNMNTVQCLSFSETRCRLTAAAEAKRCGWASNRVEYRACSNQVDYVEHVGIYVLAQ